MEIKARTTCIRRGRRVYSDVTLDIVEDMVEVGFIPASGERPAQDRVHAKVWNWLLGRYDLYPCLVVSGWTVVGDEASA